MKTRIFLAIGIAVAVSGCGGSSSGRYAPSYPVSFAGKFSQQCAAAHASSAMCQCAIRQFEARVTYTSLTQSVGTILQGTVDVPWFDAVQEACKRHGGGVPAYVAPNALRFLQPAPPSSLVDQALSPLIEACISHSYSPSASPPPGVSADTTELLHLASAYSLTAPLVPPIGKITTLQKALSGAVAFLRDGNCSPADAARISAATG